MEEFSCRGVEHSTAKNGALVRGTIGEDLEATKMLNIGVSQKKYTSSYTCYTK